MSDQAVLLPKWSPHGRIRSIYSYTFWTMPIYKFGPVYFFSAHPLPVLPWLSNRLNNSKSSFEFLYHLGYIILLSPYEQLGNWVWILNGVWVPEFIYWGLVLQRGRREYILINLLKHNAFNIFFFTLWKQSLTHSILFLIFSLYMFWW